MFYCNDCRKRNRWPDSFRTSLGSCEVCGTKTDCFDVPSSYLPLPAKPPPPQQVDAERMALFREVGLLKALGEWYRRNHFASRLGMLDAEEQALVDAMNRLIEQVPSDAHPF